MPAFTIDPADVQRYRDGAAGFDLLLADLDDPASGISGGRRARVLTDAVRAAETDLARIDPRHSEVIGRCVVALWRQNHRSSWVADTVGRAVVQVGTTHEHAGGLYESVHDTRDRMWGERRRAPWARRRLARVEAEAGRVAADPAASGHAGLVSVDRIAQRLLGCGRYAEAMARFDAVIGAFPDAGLTGLQAEVFAVSLGLTLENLGEPARTADLLSAYERTRWRDADGGAGDSSSPDRLAAEATRALTLGRCLIGARRSAAAAARLGTALRTLESHRAAWADPQVHRLAHRITYELGSALWQQGRRRQAATRFVAALDLLREVDAVDDVTRNSYRNAVLLSAL